MHVTVAQLAAGALNEVFLPHLRFEKGWRMMVLIDKVCGPRNASLEVVRFKKAYGRSRSRRRHAYRALLVRESRDRT